MIPIAVIVLGTVFYVAAATSNNWKELQQHANDIDSFTARHIRERCYIPETVNATKCVADAQQSAQDKHRAENDLYSQRQMAAWAVSMGVTGLISIPLTGAGIFFVWRSLKLNRDAVDAANKSARIAEEAARDQNRAYVHIKGVSWIETSDKAVFKFLVQNSGSTPCLRYKIAAIARSIRADADTPHQPNFSVDLQGWSGLPGNETHSSIVHPVFPDGEDKFLARDSNACAVFIGGTVFYQTFFGEVFSSEFSFVGTGRGDKISVGRKGKRMIRSSMEIEVFKKIDRSDVAR